MTMNMVDWALRQDLPPAKKLLLVTLAWVSDDCGVTFKSQKTVGTRVGESDRWVREHLPALAAAGLVSRYARHEKSGRRTTDLLVLNGPRSEPVDLTVYSGILGSLEQGDRPPGENPPGPPPAKTRQGTRRESAGGPGENPPTNKPIEETSLETEQQGETGGQPQLAQTPLPVEHARLPVSDEKTKKEADAREVFDYWVRVTKPKRETFTASRQRTIERALNEADVALCKQAIDGMVAFQAQRGGDLTLSRCLQSRPGGSPLLETIEWWASQAPSARVDETTGFRPSMPTGLDTVFAASMRARLDSLRSYHLSPQSQQSKDLAVSAVAWLKQRGFLVGRNPDGSPYIYDQNEQVSA